MIDSSLFDEIRQKYGHYASWAVWAEVGLKPKSNVGDLSVFDIERNSAVVNSLNPNIIMVGLNISRPIEFSFGNFHDARSQSQDYKLRYAFTGTPFWGAYMTDVIKDFEQKISGEVMKYMRNNRDFEVQNVEAFKQEIIDIKANDPQVIAFGNDCYSVLERHLKGELQIIKVPHYSMQIGTENYRQEVMRLLSVRSI